MDQHISSFMKNRAIALADRKLPVLELVQAVE
jgi:hypothetical protein